MRTAYFQYSRSQIQVLENIILPSKSWYQNTHKINTEGLKKAEIFVLYLVRLTGCKTQEQYLFSTLVQFFFLPKYYFTPQILIPKYSKNKWMAKFGISAFISKCLRQFSQTLIKMKLLKPSQYRQIGFEKLIWVRKIYKTLICTKETI